MGLGQGAYDGEIRAPVAAKGLKHPRQSEYEIFGGDEDALRRRLERTVLHGKSLDVTGGEIQGSHLGGIDKFAEERTKVRMLTNFRNMANQIGRSKFSVQGGIYDSSRSIDLQFSGHGACEPAFESFGQ